MTNPRTDAIRCRYCGLVLELPCQFKQESYECTRSYYVSGTRDFAYAEGWRAKQEAETKGQ